jgi:hypothetical protein
MVWSSVNLISWQFGAHKQRGKLCSSLYVNRRRPLINLWSTFGETIILYSSQILYLMNNLFLRDFNESIKALLKRKIRFIILIWFSISVHVTLYIYINEISNKDLQASFVLAESKDLICLLTYNYEDLIATALNIHISDLHTYAFFGYSG